MRLLGYVLFVAVMLSACDQTATPTPTPPASIWGEIITITQAEQSNAPALLPMLDGIAFAWIGADHTGVHQDMRVLRSTGLTDTVVLPLPPRHPYDQTIAPADAGGLHFLWLDSASDELNDESRLFSGNVTSLLQVDRGPFPVSDRHTLHYTFIANDDGSLWAVWSGGFLYEPGLYATYVDPLSRPDAPRHLVNDADWPVLMHAANGLNHVFWTQSTSGRVYHGILGDGEIVNAGTVTTTPVLQTGDRLVNISVGMDLTHACLFWNITHANGTPESWFACGELESDTWNSPQRLGIDLSSTELFVTGYNSGDARAASAGETWLSWASPAQGQFDVLAVAAQVEDGLAMVYLRGGQIAGYQRIAPLKHSLIGIPVLSTDRSRHLYVAWAEPTAQGYSALKFTDTTR